MTILTVLALLLQEGPHLPLSAEAAAKLKGFEKGERIVAARYLLEKEESLSDHPPKGAGGARKNLTDMTAAGIDVAFVEYRSAAPLKAMATALEAMEGDKIPTPRVALLLPKADAAAMRDFFSLVPPRFWALLDGRPLVRLDAPADGKALEELRERMKADAGRECHVVAASDVVDVRPGAAREKGVTYQRSWYVATRIKPCIAMVETWNRFGDASEVCESAEHGREYVESTARFADRFRKGELVPNPAGAWSRVAKVVWNLKYEPFEGGLKPLALDDGLFDIAELTGIKMLTTKKNEQGETRCVYFAVDDSFRYYEKRTFDILVEYLDKGSGTFSLEYDAADGSATKSAGEEPFTDTGEWKFARFKAADALLGNRQAGGADFRLVVKKRGLTIRRVSVTPQ